mmetsp:Transcript_106543/g.318403  ORF Transcript_106543/g.318403 Transcript_106543/m.318403 type:complete len:248 (-) Transcript_106543:424-1167(-)
MSGVWKAPELVTSFAWRAPFAFTSFSSFSIDALVPPQVAPFGKSAFATWQTVPSPISLLTSLQRLSSLSRLRPATESSAWAPPLVDASAIASDRTFMIFRPSSKDITPAATSAANSPTPRPATAPGRATASGVSSFSFSRPARPAMNITGWQTSVFSSLDPGPVRQTSKGSQPRMPLAVLSMSFTAGMSFTPLNILTYCEPWPGKSKPAEVGCSVTSKKKGLHMLLSFWVTRLTSAGSRPVDDRLDG